MDKVGFTIEFCLLMESYSDYSVVIPVFNAVDTIERAVIGAFNLSPAPQEVIVVDDMSTDGTRHLLQDLLGHFSHLVLINNDQNRGQSYSRNLGVDMASTDFIIFMDDDDVSFPERPVEHMRLRALGAQVSFISSIQIYPNGYRRMNINRDFQCNSEQFQEMIRFTLGGKGIPKTSPLYSPSSVLAIDKNAYKQIGGFDESLRRLEDIDLLCRALQNGLKVAWSSKIGVERNYSIGVDKAPKANFSSEIMLLKRYGFYLSRNELLVEKTMVKIRRYYFQRQILHLLGMLPLVLLILILRPGKVIGITKRLMHDLRIWK
jgi:glycosyltransferase involved in cell wall biosynthesis